MLQTVDVMYKMLICVFHCGTSVNLNSVGSNCKLVQEYQIYIFSQTTVNFSQYTSTFKFSLDENECFIKTACIRR